MKQIGWVFIALIFSIRLAYASTCGSVEESEAPWKEIKSDIACFSIGGTYRLI